MGKLKRAMDGEESHQLGYNHRPDACTAATKKIAQNVSKCY
jgi:hypothetical protein